MEHKLLAVVVVYYPELSQLKNNIDAFLDDVDKILIWQNSIVDRSSFSNSDYAGKIEFVNDGTNVGISKALNYAVEYASNNGFTYLLSMDQDSIWLDFKKYKDYVLKKNVDERCILGPSIVYNRDDSNKIDRYQCVKDDWVITSGMLLQVSLIKEIGGYNEFFTVDGIDIDLCLRAFAKGYNSYQTSAGILVQRYGTPTKKYGLTIRFYNYRRLESIIQNHIILYKTYKIKSIFKELVEALWNGCLSVLFLSNKSKIFIAICRGVFSGIKY